MANRNDGSIAFFVGASRSGKSVPLKEALEHHTRAIGWDSKGELVSQCGFEKFENKHDFLEAVIAAGDGDAKLCFVSSCKKDYDFFCDVAFNFNRLKEAAIVCEELALVTNAGKGTGYWGKLTNQGLAYGLTILATAQRGQEIDKTLMGNASFLHVTKQNMLKDRMYMAAMLGIDAEEIPSEALKFLHWTSDKGIVAKGSIDFTGKPRGCWSEKSPVIKTKGKITKVLPNGELKNIDYR